MKIVTVKNVEVENGSPLLSIGSFGVHLKSNPAGTWSFVGSAPNGLHDVCYKTFEEGVTAFKTWFLACDKSLQREWVANLRSDVFSFIFTA